MPDSSAERSRVHYPRKTVTLIGFCFVLSGATGLIYEVLWARMLGLVFGATTLAISTVLAAFMGGLALGSALASRFGPRVTRPLVVYGWMEIVVAVYALCLPLLFRVVDSLYVLIWQQLQPSFVTFSLWRFLLSTLLLLLPTCLMGATLPVLSRAVAYSSKGDSRSVARLYSLNLVGAILGTIIAGFFLLPLLGVKRTMLVGVIINVAIGILAITLEKSRRHEALTTVDTSGVADHLSEVIVSGKRFWFAAAFVSGFVTMSTQVTWTRLLTMVIGSSTYAFSIVLALFLIGLAIAASIIGRLRISVRLRVMIVAVELLTAISLFGSLLVVNKIPSVLVNLGLKFNVSSWSGLLALQIFSASLLILFPSLLMGAIMPLVLLWANSSNSDVVRLTGRSYAINTIGAIAGAFLTGFVFIPQLSTKFTVLFSAALCLMMAGYAVANHWESGTPSRNDALRRALAIGATTIGVIVLFALAPRVNVADLSIGAYDSLIRLLAKSREGAPDTASNSGAEDHRLLMYEEGSTSTVSVRRDQGIISMAINGRTNASDSIYDMPTQIMLAQVPVLLAPHAGSGLVIGFATGVSVGSMLQSPIESVTCVELEQATIKGSRFFDHVNNEPLKDKRLKVVIDDARTHLRVTNDYYDIIASEPSHPWVPGVANLFTQEFFQIGKDRLTDNGVFVQWLQIYQLSTDSLRSVLATYLSVFPHVMVFRVGGVLNGKDLILVGSKAPLNLDVVREHWNDVRVSSELQRVLLKSPEDFKAWLVCDESKLGPAVQDAVLNTDDNMHIETQVPREAFRPFIQSNAEWLNGLKGF